MLIDCGVALPLIDEPVANPELEAQFFHIPVKGIEVLVMHHARRHMDRIPLIPVVAFAADLGVSISFQRI